MFCDFFMTFYCQRRMEMYRYLPTVISKKRREIFFWRLIIAESRIRIRIPRSEVRIKIRIKMSWLWNTAEM
jgi:hypothetical protein